MWIQFLLPFLALAGSIPIIGWQLDKRILKRQGALELEAPVGATAQAVEAPKPTAAAINGNILDDGIRRFGKSVEVLEKRALENSDHNIYGYLASLLKELETLQLKLTSNGIDQQARLTYAKYLPLVQKVTELTSPNFYGDFIRNPDHWKNPQAMRKQVELSVLAVAQTVSEDIRRLNSEQQLDFQVNIESIIGKTAAELEEGSPEPDMAELLADPHERISGVKGNLESLTSAVTSEAEKLKARQEEEREAERAAEEEALQLEKKFQAGSRAALEAEIQEQDRVRPTIISRELFRQTFTLYGPSSSSKNFLANHSNLITGEREWKEFNDSLEAAAWIDGLISQQEAKHDHNCNCVYCKEDSE